MIDIVRARTRIKSAGADRTGRVRDGKAAGKHWTPSQNRTKMPTQTLSDPKKDDCTGSVGGVLFSPLERSNPDIASFENHNKNHSCLDRKKFCGALKVCE